jgi:hypothetical protein
MWYKELFEAYDASHEIQERINAINEQLRYVKNTIEDTNIPSSIMLPSDVEALRDISYVKIMKNENTLSSELYSKLMDQCIKFTNDYPNINDEKFVDEIVNIFGYTQNF